MGSHSFCANLAHFEVGSHSSEAANLDRSGCSQLKYGKYNPWLSANMHTKWLPCVP